MKKIRLVMLATLITGLVSCGDDDGATPNSGGSGGGGGDETGLTVEATQNSFLGYVGATWCPPCGAYGGPAFKFIKDQYMNKEVVPLYFAQSGETSAYINSGGNASAAPFISEFYTAMKAAGTIPFFNINGTNEGGVYITPESTSSQYKPVLDDLIGPSADIGIAAKKTLTDTELSCEVKVKAFNEYTGDLYYCVLAIEKTATGFQKITGQADAHNYEHINITRASLVGDGTASGQEAFESFASGTTAAEEEFTKTFSYTFEAFDPGSSYLMWNYTPDNTMIVAMVWEKDSQGDWIYVNGVIAE